MTASFRRILRGSRGFSMIEALVGIAIVAVSLIFLIGIYTSAFNSSQRGTDLAAGTGVAEKFLNEYIEVNREKLNDPSVTIDPEAGTFELNQIVFYYTVEVAQTISTVGTGNPYQLRQVDVNVLWWQSEDEQEFKEQFASSTIPYEQKQKELESRSKRRTPSGYLLTSTRISRLVFCYVDPT